MNLDPVPTAEQESIVRLAAHVCNTLFAGLKFIDSDRAWFKAKYGVFSEYVDYDDSFCKQLLMSPVDTLIVEDAAADERFVDNLLVKKAPNVRFFMGVPLVTPDKPFVIGALCVMDTNARAVSVEEVENLKTLAQLAMSHMHLRLTFDTLLAREEALNDYRRQTKQELLSSIKRDAANVELADRFDN
jgi:GAF domain-containing protein